MHQWQKFGENPSTDTGDIAETWNYHVNQGRMDGQRHGRTTWKHIASAGAYRRRRLKNNNNNNGTCKKTGFENLCLTDKIEVEQEEDKECM